MLKYNVVEMTINTIPARSETAGVVALVASRQTGKLTHTI